ncbi:TolC family protein [Leptospira sp. GIMC2001]|uniref:TolC family protein n=1 Tax=Leptospira sp. GIMC2001 TaxID=1513297 RepID=UPI00234B09F5|nr:TolC family protein [Leptospira sp. GIMC2001]WCL49765.1 TolC family protein [Leptospira sp. GIMC2001]
MNEFPKLQKVHLFGILFHIALIGIVSGIIAEEKTSTQSPVQAIQFADISLSIQKHSFNIMALEKESLAAESGRDRYARHWHPRIYLDARIFNSNDPAVNFFSKLGQRDVRQSDFSTQSSRNQIGNYLDSNNQPYTNLNSNTLNLLAPDTLNYPGANTYQRGTLGLDLPIYEGGSKSNLAESYDLISSAKKFEKKSVILSEYSTNAGLYAQTIVLNDYKQNLEKIISQINGILGSYQIGSRSNPVGYSGLLGLKTLKNRVIALEEEVDSRKKSIIGHINSVSIDLNENWDVQMEPIQQFLDKHLPYNHGTKEKFTEAETISYLARAMQLYAESSSRMSEIEKAKFLPKLGLYGESNLYSGSRNTSSAYNVGFYVQMNLYNGEDLGSYQEAKLKSEANLDRARDQIRSEDAKKKDLRQRIISIQKQIKLIEDSSKFMDEQVINSRKLFANGSINAMQMSEVIARCIDLTLDRANLEKEFVITRAEMYALSSGTINLNLNNLTEDN